MVQTDLVGEYVTIPRDGDAGTIRAVYNRLYSQVRGHVRSELKVLVQRDNQANDLKSYNIEDIVLKGKPL